MYANASPAYLTYEDFGCRIAPLYVTTNLNSNYKVTVSPTPRRHDHLRFATQRRAADDRHEYQVPCTSNGSHQVCGEKDIRRRFAADHADGLTVNSDRSG